MVFHKTSILITEEQDFWVENNSINLSEWVRKRLNEAMGVKNVVARRKK